MYLLSTAVLANGDLDLYLVGIGPKFSFSYLSAKALLFAKESFK